MPSSTEARNLLLARGALDLFTSEEAALYCDRTERALANAVRAGRLSVGGRGGKGRAMYLKGELDRFLRGAGR